MLSEKEGLEQLKNADVDELAAPKNENTELIKELLNELLSLESPYIPRPGLVWQGQPTETEGKAPDHNGLFSNASMTHLGALEIIRLNVKEEPTEIDFVPLDDLSDMLVAFNNTFRYAKLFYDNGQPEEIVWLPLLYGYSWNSPHDYDTDGTMTRFICTVEVENSARPMSIGIGHQDFFVQGKSQVLFGLGSIGSVSMPLYVKDPKFDQKCRARGLDPEAVKEQMKGK